MQPSDLKDLLAVREQKLTLSLAETRATFAQSGDKGSDLERAFREFLRVHLPRRYEVGQGEVIDSSGHRSGQTDVVVTDDDNLFSAPEGTPGLFLVEAVAAAAEVKATLTTQGVADSLEKARRFKELQKYAHVGDLTFSSTNPAEDRYFSRPGFFAFAYESDVAMETLLARLAEEDRGRGSNPLGLDAVFILGEGIAVNLGDGLDKLQVNLGDGGNATGWVWTASELVLGDLLVWLGLCTRRTVRFTNPITAYLQQLLGQREYYTPI